MVLQVGAASREGSRDSEQRAACKFESGAAMGSNEMRAESRKVRRLRAASGALDGAMIMGRERRHGGCCDRKHQIVSEVRGWECDGK